MAHFKITKGLNLPISGAAEKNLSKIPLGKYTGLSTADYHFKYKLLCKVDDYVKVGTPLVANKQNTDLRLVSTASGRIKEIIRGDRRALLAIVIETDGTQDAEEFGTLDATADRATIISKLLESGMWHMIKQRPFDVVADPTVMPKAIFVNCMSNGPLAPSPCFISKGREAQFKKGLALMTKLTEGTVHLSKSATCKAEAYANAEGVETHTFEGPHPAGLTSTHINRIDPINMNEQVWTVNAENVILFGAFAESGTIPTDKVIAVTGGNAEKPAYYTVNRQIQMEDIVKAVGVKDNSRLISGNVLHGRKRTADQFMSQADTQITVIPEGGEHHYIGEDRHWTGGGINSFSTFRLF
ncbi:MAG: hypothetical protein OCD01_16250, partial [Fibrobacterales bacterium]